MLLVMHDMGDAADITNLHQFGAYIERFDIGPFVSFQQYQSVKLDQIRIYCRVAIVLLAFNTQTKRLNSGVKHLEYMLVIGKEKQTSKAVRDKSVVSVLYEC